MRNLQPSGVDAKTYLRNLAKVHEIFMHFASANSLRNVAKLRFNDLRDTICELLQKVYLFNFIVRSSLSAPTTPAPPNLD